MIWQLQFSESKYTLYPDQKKSVFEAKGEGRAVLSDKATLYNKLMELFQKHEIW